MHSKSVVIALAVLAAARPVWPTEIPLAVSPGSETGTLIEGRCPTFSWGEVAGAQSYDLVVYRVDDQAQDAEPVLRKEFSSSVYSWTPALGQCLERGVRYAWSVRSSGDESSDWSSPSLFEVAQAGEIVGRESGPRPSTGLSESVPVAPKWSLPGSPTPSASPPAQAASTAPLVLGQSGLVFPDGFLQAAAPLYAWVDQNGVTRAGNALLASRTSVGQYTVVFSRSLERCAAVGNTGFSRPYPSGTSAAFGATVSVDTGVPVDLGTGPRPNAVWVDIRLGSALVDSSFHLILICPGL